MRRVIVASVLAAAVMAMAPETARAGEPHQHDGFFLRMAPGFGYSSAKSSSLADFDGASGSFELAIGAMVSRNFAIHATFDGWALVDEHAGNLGTPVPVNSCGGGCGGYGSHDHYGNHTGVGMWGAGVTHYFGDSNVYVTASGGAARLYYDLHYNDYGDNYGGDLHSDTGFAFSTGVGKEWWVGDSWGLGVSGTYGYHSIPPAGGGHDFTGSTFAVRFSATLN